MKMETKNYLVSFFISLFLLVVHFQLIQCSVTYDRKAIIINGQRKILISGSIHYPRSTPDMWEGLIQKFKDGGLDVHEPSPGNYNFEGRNDLVRFVKTVQNAGLYLHLRIGPYVCVEWNFGGFSIWLKYVPGISFRTDNEPFKLVMGGPFEPYIESILRQKALLMNSPVISASNLGIQSLSKVLDKIYQSCDLIIQVEKDLQLV